MSLEDFCRNKIEQLESIIDDKNADIFRSRARNLKDSFTQLASANDISPEGCTALLDASHHFQRLGFLYHAKATPDIISIIDAENQKERSWAQCAELPVEAPLKEQLAGRLLHASFQHVPGGEYLPFAPGTPPLNNLKTLLIVSSSARGTAEHIVRYMLSNNIAFDVDFSDTMSRKMLYERCNDSKTSGEAGGLERYAGTAQGGLG